MIEEKKKEVEKIQTLETTQSLCFSIPNVEVYEDRKIKKKSIAIDLDGVVWNSQYILLDLYNKKYNTNYQYNDINKWDFFPTEQFYEIHNTLHKYMNLYQKTDSNLKKYIQKLYTFFDITILTQGYYTIDQIADKLQEWDITMGECYDSILCIDIEQSKVDFDFDYFIDDNPNLIETIMRYPEKELLVFEQPWNKKTFTQFNSYRVKNWKEIIEYLLPSGWKIT